MSKRSSIKRTVMMGLIPILILVLGMTILSAYINNLYSDSEVWLRQSVGRKLLSGQIKYEISKYFNLKNESKEVTEKIKESISLRVLEIDNFYLKFRQIQNERTFSNTLFKNIKLNSFAQWQQEVKASIELILDLPADEIDAELLKHILNFLDVYSSLVDNENVLIEERMQKVGLLSRVIVYSVDALLVLVIIIAYIFGSRLGNRINDFTKNIVAMNEGLEELRDIGGNDELTELREQFSHLLDKLNSTSVSKDFFESVLNSMNDPLFVLNEKGKVLHYNPSFLRDFNLSDLMKNKDSDVNFFQVVNNLQDDNSREFTWDEFIHQLKTKGILENKEVFFNTSTEVATPFLLSASLLNKENDKDKEFLIILKNISEIKKVEEKLEGERNKAIQAGKMATLGEMAGGVAHEINNPLAAIDGTMHRITRALKKEPIPIEKIGELMGKITKHTTRIAKIVNGLRTFSRDGSEDPFEKVEISFVLDEALELCQERIMNKGIKLLGLESIPKEGYLVVGQIIPLTQIFVNLLNNAHDAIEELEDKWIAISIKSRDDMVTIEVTDSGGGIPEDIREKVLQPFFTTKPTGKGTGLGLGIVTGIIEKHRGKIFIDADCENTRFVVNLPSPKTEEEAA